MTKSVICTTECFDVIGIALHKNTIFVSTSQDLSDIIRDDKIVKVSMFNLDGKNCVNLDMFMNRPSLFHLKDELLSKISFIRHSRPSKDRGRKESHFVVEYYTKIRLNLGPPRTFHTFDRKRAALFRFLTQFNIKLIEGSVDNIALLSGTDPIFDMKASEALNILIKAGLLTKNNVH